VPDGPIAAVVLVRRGGWHALSKIAILRDGGESAAGGRPLRPANAGE
jgi:hypothetical protein